MYSLINAHIDEVLGQKRAESDIQEYITLARRFGEAEDVSADREFQKMFRVYWQMNVARLGDPFYSSYFSLLQEHRSDMNITVEAVARELSRVGKGALQFSFSSKLVHMIRRTTPIYDSAVAAFFFLLNVTQLKSFESKLKALSAAYEFLSNEYRRVLGAGLLGPAIAEFRKRFDSDAVYTDEKVIETLIWLFVRRLRTRDLRESQVAYG